MQKEHGWRRLMQRAKAAPLYREIRNMPPPPVEPEAEALPERIYFRPVDDPYEWFTPRR